VFPFRKGECRAHVFREVADLHVLGDELHGDVVAYTVDGDGGVFFYLAGDAVQEAFLEPFPRAGNPHMLLCGLIPLERGAADAGMVSGVIPADVILQDGVKFMQGMDPVKVKPV